MAMTLRRGLTIVGFNVQGDIGPYTVYTSRRGKFVVFDRAPPLAPASYAQLRMRNTWRLAALGWRLLPEAQKQNWERATQTLDLTLTGYNLWIFWRSKRDRPSIQTIERQARVTLLTPEAE